MNLKKILVATDFSKGAEVALERAIELSHKYEAELLVVHVVEPTPRYPAILELWSAGTYFDTQTQINNYLLEETKKILEQLCEKLTVENIKCRQFFEVGQPHKEILKIAQNEKVDLLVLGHTGHGYIEHRLLGQVVDRLVRQAKCMTLVVPIESAYLNNH